MIEAGLDEYLSFDPDSEKPSEFVRRVYTVMQQMAKAS
jgi:hypothetical protein